MILTIKQADTRHAIRATLKAVDGGVLNLTGATVRFKMANHKGDVLVNRLATAGTGGVVEFIFADGETDVIGLHGAEFLVTYADGRIETFPHRGTIGINIEGRIGKLTN